MTPVPPAAKPQHKFNFFARGSLFTLVVIGLVHGSVASAGLQVSKSDLIKSSDRPPMTDVGRAFEGGARVENKNAAESPSLLNADAIQALPKIIAQAELAYPGLRYVIMGRDASFFGDAIEAFYLSRGQADRVIRFSGSGQTIMLNDGQIFSLLQEAGFRPTPEGVDRPFILFDRTTYTRNATKFNEFSQIKRLLSAGFRVAKQLGLAPGQIKRQFGAIALTESGSTPVSRFNVKKFFATWRLKTESADFDNRRRTIEAPAKIFQVDASALVFAKGTTQYRYEWHGSFGGPQVRPSGKMMVNHGPINTYNTPVLTDEMLWLYDAVKQDAFQNAVDLEFKKLHLSPVPRNELAAQAAAGDEAISGPAARLFELSVLENSKIFSSEMARTSEIAGLIKSDALQKIFNRYMMARTTNPTDVSGDEATSLVASILARTEILQELRENKLDQGQAYHDAVNKCLTQISLLGQWTFRRQVLEGGGAHGTPTSVMAPLEAVGALFDGEKPVLAPEVVRDLHQAWIAAAPKRRRALDPTEARPTTFGPMVRATGEQIRNYTKSVSGKVIGGMTAGLFLMDVGILSMPHYTLMNNPFGGLFGLSVVPLFVGAKGFYRATLPALAETFRQRRWLKALPEGRGDSVAGEQKAGTRLTVKMLNEKMLVLNGKKSSRKCPAWLASMFKSQT